MKPLFSAEERLALQEIDAEIERDFELSKSDFQFAEDFDEEVRNGRVSKQVLQKREYNRRRYYANRESILAKRKEYYKENREVLLPKLRKYIRENRDRVNIQRRDYRRRKRENSGGL